MDYLSQSAVFTCPMGYPATIIPGQFKITTTGGPVLTEAAKIKIVGVCPKLNPNVPPPCPNSFSPWAKTVGSSIAAGGRMLTKDSFCTCACGKISVQNSGVASKLVKQSAPDVNIADIVIDAVATSATANANGTSCKTDAKANVNSSVKNSGGSMAVTQKGSVTQEKQNATTVKSINNRVREDLLCSYSPDKKKCVSCAYKDESMSDVVPEARTASGEPKVASTALRENYLASLHELHQNADIRYKELWDQYQNSRWSYQAHHVISRLDGYGVFPRLVKLGNFCGYDINNAHNCIMLLSFLRREHGAPKRTSTEGTEEAYIAMKDGKMQWHTGPHDYGTNHGIFSGEGSQDFAKADMELLRKQVNLYLKLNVKEVYDYATLIVNELRDLDNYLFKHKKCWLDRKDDFISIMNGISHRIKKYLGAFQDLPYKSYPYFVSQEAYMYAFNVPRTNKIIVADLKDGQPYFEKFRAKRYVYAMKNDEDSKYSEKDMRYEHLYDGGGDNNENYRAYSLEDKKSKVNFIRFIEDSEYIVVLSKVVKNKMDKVLKLSYADCVSDREIENIDGYGLDLTDEHRAGGETDYTRVLYKYDSKILVWLRNHKKINTTKSERIKRFKERYEGGESQ